MEKLKELYKQVYNAHKTLSEGLDMIEHPHKNVQDAEMQLYRDGVIQRFEYSYDITWKYLKEFLKDKYGVAVASPREVFKACQKQKLITPQETEKCMEMTDDRNLTTHTYDQDNADGILKKIRGYEELMKAFAQKFKP